MPRSWSKGSSSSSQNCAQSTWYQSECTDSAALLDSSGCSPEWQLDRLLFDFSGSALLSAQVITCCIHQGLSSLLFLASLRFLLILSSSFLCPLRCFSSARCTVRCDILFLKGCVPWTKTFLQYCKVFLVHLCLQVFLSPLSDLCPHLPQDLHIVMMLLEKEMHIRSCPCGFNVGERLSGSFWHF